MKAPSYLYVMQDGIGRVKIGYSMRPDQRRYGLGRDVKLLWQTIAPRPDAHLVEGETLVALRPYRSKWEWYWIDPEQAIRALSHAMSRADAGEQLRRIRLPEHGDGAPPRQGWTKEEAASMVQKSLEYDSSRSRLKALGLERVVTYRRKKR